MASFSLPSVSFSTLTSDLSQVPIPFFIIIGTSIALALHYAIFYDSRRKHLPPSPKSWPLVGNTFQINLKNDPNIQLMSWAKDLGEIYHLRLGASDFIFLNSPRTVKDLLDKRGNIYSDRPHLPMAGEAYTKGLNLSLMGYNQRWKTHRRLMQGMLTQKQAETFRPIQQYESQQLAVDWLDSPHDYYHHNRRYAFSLIMQVVYGRRFPKWGSKEADGIFSVNRNLSTTINPGAYLVDTFPSLAKIPGFGTIIGNWRRVGERLFQADAKILCGYYERMRDEMRRAVGYPCFARDLELSDPPSHGMDDVEAAFLAGGLVMPGSESTSALLNWLVRGLSEWPEVQIAAREELDRVVGAGRTPAWEDEPSLPYIRAMVKELLRWCPGSKFGLIHATTKDDWYEGMFIPKGAQIVGNQWALQFDDERFPDPWRYDPTRYIGTTRGSKSAFESLNVSNPEERDHWGYGAGRRWCPGIHVAEKSLFINIARIMWGFDIQKPKGAGEEWRVYSSVEGAFNIPKEDAFVITPRSSSHAKVLREEWAEAQKKGLHYTPAPREVFTGKLKS